MQSSANVPFASLQALPSLEELLRGARRTGTLEEGSALLQEPFYVSGRKDVPTRRLAGSVPQTMTRIVADGSLFWHGVLRRS